MTDPRDQSSDQVPKPDARRTLQRLASEGPEVDADRDASIRVAIHRSFEHSPSELRLPAVHTRRRWVAAWASIAALVAIAIGGSLWLRGALNDDAPTSRVSLASALRAADAAADRGASRVSDARVQAILAAIVAMSSEGPLPTSADARFIAFDLVLDAGPAPLAAFRTELHLPGPIVGIEGGDAPFAIPATYDANALASGHVILASVAADVNVRAEGSTRLATIMVRAKSDDAASPTDTSLLASDGSAMRRALRIVARPAPTSAPTTK